MGNGTMAGRRTAVSAGSSVLGLVVWIAITAVAAAIGSAAAANSREFYEGLQRPDWAPPASVFGPVWTVLYLLMAISAWLIWREFGFKSAKPALALFTIQLGANALWSWVFFVWKQGGLAFAEVILLWCLIVATVAAFRRLNGWAAVLMFPYLVWVTFASALTFATWRLNPALL